MNQRRKFRPSVNGLEQRLALNGTLGAAGLMGQGAHAVVDVKHMAGAGHTHHHTSHHTTHHTSHKGK